MEMHWLRPPVVRAPSAENQTQIVSYAISEQFMGRNSSVVRLSPIFQMWVHVVGKLPPINNVRRVFRGTVVPDVTTLADSVALFRGVRRPYDDEEQGESVLVYVLNPTATIAYEVDPACLAKASLVPPNTCLTVQVKPAKSLQVHGESVQGVVTRLEFVSGSREGGNPILPLRHSDRYIERLWQR
jgi:hypothetical protein